MHTIQAQLRMRNAQLVCSCFRLPVPGWRERRASLDREKDVVSMAESPDLFDDDDSDLGYNKEAYFSPKVPLQLVTRRPKRTYSCNADTESSESDGPSTVPIRRKEPLQEQRNSESLKSAKYLGKENPSSDRDHISTAPKRRKEPLQQHRTNEINPKHPKMAKDSEKKTPSPDSDHPGSTTPNRGQEHVQELNSKITPKRPKTAQDLDKESPSSGVESTLLKTNKLLTTLVKKMDSYEERIKAVEKKVNGSPGSSRTRIVPLEVRVSVFHCCSVFMLPLILCLYI